MKNIRTDFLDNFRDHGGTELAPMSTSSNVQTAMCYSKSKVPLALKYKVAGMSKGVLSELVPGRRGISLPTVDLLAVPRLLPR
jgi:hypothetical protein